MKKRIPLIITAAALLLFAGLFFFLYRNNDTLRFQKLSEEIFAQSLSQDSLSLHYTLADPSPYLKAPSPATLPAYSRESQKEAAALLENQLLVLQEINPEKLNSHDRYTWSLLTSYLENELAGARCEYYEEPLAPSSGMQSQLPVLLAEYTFRTKSDMEDYLEILESIPAYLESLAVYEKEKANAGLFMTEADAGEIVDQCDAIMAPDLLSAGEHFLQTTFQERLDGLVEDGQLKPEEEEFYISENNRLLTTVVSPAYTLPWRTAFPPFRLRFPQRRPLRAALRHCLLPLPAAQKYRQLPHSGGNPVPAIRSVPEPLPEPPGAG